MPELFPASNHTVLNLASAGIIFCAASSSPESVWVLCLNHSPDARSKASSVTPAQLPLVPTHAKRAQVLIDKAIAYLRSQQDPTTGGWSVHKDGVTFPAIAALVIDGMLADPAIDATDPAIDKAIDFLLSYRQPTGGIYDRILPNYNTAIALSALARADTPKARKAIKDAQAFLIGLQWNEDAIESDAAKELGVGKVTPDHPFYGGVGYGKHGRPDLSNLSFMLQALHDSGYDADSPPFHRAITYLQRVQMDHRFNDMPYAKETQQGGFIYATSTDKEHLGVGQSQAGTYEETLDDGRVVSSLRCYGSMTYAGFKSYLYADLNKTDPRVQAVLGWVKHNYTLQENPGIGDQGYYYYIATFARAMQAWNEPTIQTIDEQGNEQQRTWAADLVEALEPLQQPDGSFAIRHKRWLENDPVLVTAYSLIALEAAREQLTNTPQPAPTTP